MQLTRLQFEEELQALRNMLLTMGNEADRAVADSIRALTDRDVPLAEQVITNDDRLDAMDLEIEILIGPFQRSL